MLTHRLDSLFGRGCVVHLLQYNGAPRFLPAKKNAFHDDRSGPLFCSEGSPFWELKTSPRPKKMFWEKKKITLLLPDEKVPWMA